MKILPEVGDTVLVKKYCHNNIYGGTEIVEKPIICEITKSWIDDECGWRYHADPANGIHDVIYISEFDIVRVIE